MSCLHSIAATCAAAVIATHLFAAPALANGYGSSSGGFLSVRSGSVTLHIRSTHPVNRYYVTPKVYVRKSKPKGYDLKGTPKVHYHKTKPRVYYTKPVRKKHRRSFGHYNRWPSPTYFPPLYGTKSRQLHPSFSPY